MRERGETDAALSPSCKQAPVEREPGRGRLERIQLCPALLLIMIILLLELWV